MAETPGTGVETVVIHSPRNSSQQWIINKADFNPQKHRLWSDEGPEEVAPAFDAAADPALAHTRKRMRSSWGAGEPVSAKADPTLGHGSKEPRPVIADGVRYPSVSAAAEALGLSRPGMIARLRRKQAHYEDET